MSISRILALNQTGLYWKCYKWFSGWIDKGGYLYHRKTKHYETPEDIISGNKANMFKYDQSKKCLKCKAKLSSLHNSSIVKFNCSKLKSISWKQNY